MPTSAHKVNLLTSSILSNWSEPDGRNETSDPFQLSVCASSGCDFTNSLFYYTYKDSRESGKGAKFRTVKRIESSLDFRFSTSIGAISSRLSGDSDAILFSKLTYL